MVQCIESEPGSSLLTTGCLSQAQLDQYNRDGFLAIPGFATREECAAMMHRANELVADFDPATRSIFSTADDNKAHSHDPYFLESINNISFFFEEKAFDEQGELTVPKHLSINKIGHAMHDLDPVFRAYARCPRFNALLRSLGYKRPLLIQSMYIFKQPNIGGEVVPHQDSSFLYTEPPSVTGMWLALEDANKDNGCMYALPGSHKDGLARRFVRSNEGGLAFDAPMPSYDLSKFEPIECPAGTLVLLHGSNVHYSAENTSPISRHSFTMHAVEGTAPWSADNWAQRRPDFPFQPVYDDSQLASNGTH